MSYTDVLPGPGRPVPRHGRPPRGRHGRLMTATQRPAPGAPVLRMWAPTGVRVDSAYVTDVRRAAGPVRDSWLNPPDRDGKWLTLTAHSGAVLGYVYADGEPAETRAALAALAAGLGGGFWFGLDTLTAERPDPDEAAEVRAAHARVGAPANLAATCRPRHGRNHR
jgi:hypothetical protein